MHENIYYYLDERGRNPVKEFIHNLPRKERAKVYSYVDILSKEGHNLRRPMADYLKNGIYELRPKHNRIFYFFFAKEGIILIHAIYKNTDQILENDLNVCLRRKQEVEIEQYNQLEKFSE